MMKNFRKSHLSVLSWKNTEYLSCFCHDHFSKSENDTNDLIMKIPSKRNRFSRSCL